MMTVPHPGSTDGFDPASATPLAPIAVLFVCMGNICRSPSAEGVFRELILREGYQEKFIIDSAGTHAYHIGDKPDPRSIEAAKKRQVDLTMLRGRQVALADFDTFDHILAMDRTNLLLLQQQAPRETHPKIELFLQYADTDIEEVPDPYFGGESGFEQVLDLIEMASQGFLEATQARYPERF